MASIAEASSLFEIDVELDGLLEEIEGQVESEGQAAEDLVARFQQFCEAHGEKVDRIGRFVALWKPENSIAGVRLLALVDRARAAAGKVERTKNMVLYYLLSRDIKKIEGYQFTLRAQKNSQDSVRITDEAAVPKCYCRIDARIDGVPSVIRLNPAIRDRVKSGHREMAEDVIVLPCRRVALQGGQWRVDVQTL